MAVGEGKEPLAVPVMDYRLGSTDWIPALGEVGGLERIAVLGAGAVANASAVAKLQSIVPGRHGFRHARRGLGRRDRGGGSSVARRSSGPQLVLVGLGMPLQEEVLRRRLDSLPPAVYCAVGGAIEQIAGIQKLAPRWLGRLGLEWAWRLCFIRGAWRTAFWVSRGCCLACWSGAACKAGRQRAGERIRLELLVLERAEPLAAKAGGKCPEPVGQAPEVAAAQEIAQVAADVGYQGLDAEVAADQVAAVAVVVVPLERRLRDYDVPPGAEDVLGFGEGVRDA